MKNPDGSHSHTPIDHDPRNDVPPQKGVDTEYITRDLEKLIELEVSAKLRRIAGSRGLPLRHAVPFLLAELRG